MSDYCPCPRPPQRGTFLSRPNRFLLKARLDDGRTVAAFLPNPGRLRELLLPSATVYLVPEPADSRRRTRWTAVAVERDGTPVFLHTHQTNAVARHLLETKQVPGLEEARVVRGEVPVGASRFDFLLQDPAGDLLLEVKSCTLFGGGVAMFPDAVTERGRRHLEELAHLNATGTRTAVLFIIHTRTARWFMPDYHTDLAFARTFLEVGRSLPILPVVVGWTKRLRLRTPVALATIPWEYLHREVADRGSYVLLLRLPRRRRLTVGRLGTLSFPAGWHIYVGSAMQHLAQRVARHQRRRKRHHWHIDALREAARDVTALPIRSARREECDLAAAVGALYAPGPQGFGSSDCACPTHLFHAGDDPLDSPAFHSLLERFRMRPPDSTLAPTPPDPA